MEKQNDKITVNETDNSLKGISTGHKQLDEITRGLQAGKLIFLAARPGMGKTSFAINLVEHVSLNEGKTCAVFSLEMPRDEIVQRLMCSYANVNVQKALSGKLGSEEWKRLMIAKEKLANSNIYIDDSSRITPAEILSKCRQLKQEAGGLDLVIIDYLQLMHSEKRDPQKYEREYVCITTDLKIMAKELEVPVMVLVQLKGRSFQSKEPNISDVRDLGAVEEDADTIIFLHRPGVVDSSKTELIIPINRLGEKGKVQLEFINEYMKFVDADK